MASMAPQPSASFRFPQRAEPSSIGGTLPQKATDAQWDHEREHGEWPEIKGAKIAFTARLEPSRDDEAFGFYKRPTKVEVEFAKPVVQQDADYVFPEPSETFTAAF